MSKENIDKELRVLSLCDGMSCGRIALEQAGYKVGKYYAAEIKDFAIRTTKENYPDTIHIGDVNNIYYKDGILHTENGEFEETFDLVIFGSPCQSFSRSMKADRRIGLEDKVRSGLFLECQRILKEVNPKYFLMENVVMKEEDKNVITEMIGVNPIRINSSLMTAQMRDRLYWTNIPNVTVPEDMRIKMSDIINDGYYPYEKSRCLMKNDSHGYYNGCNWTPCKRFYRWYYKAFTTMVFPSEENYMECVDEFEKVVGDNKKATASMFDDYVGSTFDQARYLYKEERARLQGVPEEYVKGCTEKEAADLLGDGWTIPVIKHIFMNMEF